jgi:WXG100 family type VII secretion target
MEDSQLLQVSPQALRNVAKSLIDITGQIESELKSATASIEEISNKYKGNISSENLAAFNDCSIEFDNFKAKIAQYAGFLNNAAQAFEASDTASASTTNTTVN